MILYIDSTDYNQVTYSVFTNGKFKRKTYKVDPHKSFIILQKLEEFLISLKIKDWRLKIGKIVVNKGPGSYTGARIGAAHAQALKLSLNIPVKFLEKEKFENLVK